MSNKEITTAKELITHLRHEFRTPLFVFREMAALIKSGKQPTQRMLNDIIEECDRFDSKLDQSLSQFFQQKTGLKDT